MQELCSEVDVCRNNPAMIGEFCLEGYATYLIHLDDTHHKDGFVITSNGIYHRDYHADKKDAPSFTLFEDMGRAIDIRYEKKYRFILVFPNGKEIPIAYYSTKRGDSVGIIKLENLFRQIMKLCQEDLFSEELEEETVSPDTASQTWISKILHPFRKS